MLAGNFYFVGASTATANALKCEVNFASSHAIFRGHFPDVPIVPGVCMMQIVKELFSEHIGLPLQFRKVALMKFLSLINPLEAPTIQVELSWSPVTEKSWQLAASFSNDGVVCFKFKGVAEQGLK